MIVRKPKVCKPANAPTVPTAAPQRSKPTAAPSRSKPNVRLGGLDVEFRAKVGESLWCVARAPSGLLAAATAEGVVVFVDGARGAIRARSEATGEPPNAMAFTGDSRFLLCCADDGCARALDAANGGVIFEHTVAEEPVAGKRPRVVAADHCIALADALVAAAGRLIHACAVPSGTLEHALSADAPVRALRGAAPGAAPGWAYAAAYTGGVLLVSRGGEIVRELQSERPLRSLATSERWLAAAAFDGTVELWENVAEPAASPDGGAGHQLQAHCGSDAEALCWSADGGGLALSGKSAAVFDFTGANPPHPYRRAAGARGEPDPLPRVCMDDKHARWVAWAPHSEPRGAATTLATASSDGTVRVWQPRGTPLRKGGKGDPAQPERMKPQFYTFLKRDAAHPSGDAVGVSALVWLGEEVVAVGYETGDIVAWRLGGAAEEE